MSSCRCRDCSVELEKEKVDQWNVNQQSLDPIEQRTPNKSNCPICFSKKTLKVWRYEE